MFGVNTVILEFLFRSRCSFIAQRKAHSRGMNCSGMWVWVQMADGCCTVRLWLKLPLFKTQQKQRCVDSTKIQIKRLSRCDQLSFHHANGPINMQVSRLLLNISSFKTRLSSDAIHRASFSPTRCCQVAAALPTLGDTEKICSIMRESNCHPHTHNTQT